MRRPVHDKIIVDGKPANLVCWVKGLPHTKEDMIRWFMKRMDRVPEGAKMEMDLELIFFE